MAFGRLKSTMMIHTHRIRFRDDQWADIKRIARVEFSGDVSRAVRSLVDRGLVARAAAGALRVH